MVKIDNESKAEFRSLVAVERKSFLSSLSSSSTTTTTTSSSSSSQPSARKRRRALSVIVRKRPLSIVEKEQGLLDVVTVAHRHVGNVNNQEEEGRGGGDEEIYQITNTTLVVHEPRTKYDLSKSIVNHAFKFDAVFSEKSVTSDVYDKIVRPLVKDLDRGRQIAVFAYGQTGSGKTYTMKGLTEMTIDDIFSIVLSPQGRARGLAVCISYFEIYCSKVFDLLNDKSLLVLREDGEGIVQIVGLSEHSTRDPLVLRALIDCGANCRSVGTTRVNADSSRSHAVLQLFIREGRRGGKEIKRRTSEKGSHSQFTTHIIDEYDEYDGIIGVSRLLGKLSLVDLAGSEQASESAPPDSQTHIEAAQINTSLLALKECIRAMGRGQRRMAAAANATNLHRKRNGNGITNRSGLNNTRRQKSSSSSHQYQPHTHIPFRGSKLTQILRDCFTSEGASTVMVTCVSPSHISAEHTLGSLRYADRLKGISIHSSQNTSSSPTSTSLNQIDIDDDTSIQDDDDDDDDDDDKTLVQKTSRLSIASSSSYNGKASKSILSENITGIQTGVLWNETGEEVWPESVGPKPLSLVMNTGHHQTFINPNTTLSKQRKSIGVIATPPPLPPVSVFLPLTTQQQPFTSSLTQPNINTLDNTSHRHNQQQQQLAVANAVATARAASARATSAASMSLSKQQQQQQQQNQHNDRTTLVSISAPPPLVPSFTKRLDTADVLIVKSPTKGRLNQSQSQGQSQQSHIQSISQSIPHYDKKDYPSSIIKNLSITPTKGKNIIHGQSPQQRHHHNDQQLYQDNDTKGRVIDPSINRYKTGTRSTTSPERDEDRLGIQHTTIIATSPTPSPRHEGRRGVATIIEKISKPFVSSSSTSLPLASSSSPNSDVSSIRNTRLSSQSKSQEYLSTNSTSLDTKASISLPLSSSSTLSSSSSSIHKANVVSLLDMQIQELLILREKMTAASTALTTTAATNSPTSDRKIRLHRHPTSATSSLQGGQHQHSLSHHHHHPQPLLSHLDSSKPPPMQPPSLSLPFKQRNSLDYKSKEIREEEEEEPEPFVKLPRTIKSRGSSTVLPPSLPLSSSRGMKEKEKRVSSTSSLTINGTEKILSPERKQKSGGGLPRPLSSSGRDIKKQIVEKGTSSKAIKPSPYSEPLVAKFNNSLSSKEKVRRGSRVSQGSDDKSISMIFSPTKPALLSAFAKETKESTYINSTSAAVFRQKRY